MTLVVFPSTQISPDLLGLYFHFLCSWKTLWMLNDVQYVHVFVITWNQFLKADAWLQPVFNFYLSYRYISLSTIKLIFAYPAMPLHEKCRDPHLLKAKVILLVWRAMSMQEGAIHCESEKWMRLVLVALMTSKLTFASIMRHLFGQMKGSHGPFATCTGEPIVHRHVAWWKVRRAALP